MALIDAVTATCTRLANAGWKRLLAHHGLDITKRDLAAELQRPLPIDRAVPGFEDFAWEGTQGIVPGNPARSLLYHAFASPNVRADPDGKPLKAFPTLAEIEAVENYVFGAQPPSLTQLRALANGGYLAIGVFAFEYRPGHETVHRRHADLCFSRTGVARVGTMPALYGAAARGFLPFVKGKAYEIRALPARYGAFVAVEWKGALGTFGPMNVRPDDANRDFWVPLHKLFDGPECIRDVGLSVLLQAEHVNQKLRRLHLVWNGKGGWKEPDISHPPFVFSDGIAELSARPADGSGLLVPVPHPLVEEAVYQGKPLTFRVPPAAPVLSSSLYVPPDGDRRRAPEFVHARHLVGDDGAVVNLNDDPDVKSRVDRGGYQAKHYLDFTGDGWIEALCPQLTGDLPRRVPAYSLVTAPDFFVNCDQRELYEWWKNSVRSALRLSLWYEPPLTLSDERVAPNLNLTSKFVKEDLSVTAIVSLPVSGPRQPTRTDSPNSMRHSWLTDAAAAVFDPGWDVSTDVSQGVRHMAAYGLGSPFPEDVKLCAALSTFWPAVAPDSARTFQPNALDTSPTVAPLTDEEIGLNGGIPWDGVVGPRITTVAGAQLVECEEFDHVDYVEAALAKKFTLVQTGAVDTREYEARVLAVARSYRALGVTGGGRDAQIRQKAQWSVLSFRRLNKGDPEMAAAEGATNTRLTMPAYRIEFYKHGTPQRVPGKVRKIHVPVRERALLFVDGARILRKRDNLPWQAVADA
jgi:hypothetical protein